MSQLRNRNRGASSADVISPPSSLSGSGSRLGLRATEELDLCTTLRVRKGGCLLGLASGLVLDCAWGLRIRVTRRGQWIGKADTQGKGGVRLSSREGRCRGRGAGERGGEGGEAKSRGLGFGTDIPESR